MLKEAFKFMWYDKAKTFGILFGMVLSVFLVGQQVMICLALLGSTVSLATFNEQYIWVVSDKSKQVIDLPLIDMRIARELLSVRGVKTASPLVFAGGNVKFPDGSKVAVSLIGTQAPYFAGGPWRVKQGKPTDLLQDGAVFLDSMNPEFGSFIKVGDQVEFNGQRVRVAGLTAQTEGLGVSFGFTTVERARKLSGVSSTQASAVLVTCQEGFPMEQVVANINQEIPGITARTGKDYGDSSLRYFATSSGIVASFGLLVVFAVITGFAIVGLTLYSAVSDRLRDYGTLKAIGGTNRTIRKLILSQALIYAISGFGIAYGLLVLFINATKGSLDLQLTPVLSMYLIGVTIFIAILGSMFGMRRIIKLEPAAVFRG
ncbi:FtsX-like permease family protein [Arundinibacter roseus]|uniref:FtsX-like permease family protein n=1 Tax=Arundinibacter roseus TaxID=2070510 RepID=A0A4R4JTW0_9BACT|nr:FtsX-like permease family protein [Arundinibacter roseus]